MKKIIQFPHPGGEHTDKTGTKWNTNNHKRKYMKVKGSYLKNLSSKPNDDTLYLWGEWEAPSSYTRIAGNASPLPLNIFEPYYTLPIPKNGANTDPFVFGNQFYYCICKQGHYPTLRNLDNGSLILFGSNKDGNFVLDTMFVVKSSLEYEVQYIENLKSKYNEVFFDVSLLPLNNVEEVESKEIIDDTKNSGICISLKGDDENDYKPACNKNDYSKPRIFEAVTYNDRKSFNGIFSYAPCLTEPNGKNGFARPEINLSYISQGLSQGIKSIKKEEILRFNPELSNNQYSDSYIFTGEEVSKIWHQITNDIINKGLNLMISTDLPKKLTNI